MVSQTLKQIFDLFGGGALLRRFHRLNDPYLKIDVYYGLDTPAAPVIYQKLPDAPVSALEDFLLTRARERSFFNVMVKNNTPYQYPVIEMRGASMFILAPRILPDTDTILPQAVYRRAPRYRLKPGIAL